MRRSALAVALAFAGPLSLLAPACKPAPPRRAAHLPGQSAEFVPPEPIIAWTPRSYVAYRAARALRIDGRLDEPAWRAAPWTADFTDIEGPSKPAPRFRTRAKLLWDSLNLYIGAELAEPDVWATLTQRDTVIFHDNDFEVFIDPDGDTQSYYELEVNALGTAWDLFLPKAYRDDGHAVNGWDIHGLQVGVRVAGTLNRPGDVDSGWTVELALPWAALRDAAGVASPPAPGDQWRINFSRVEWKTRVGPAAGRAAAPPPRREGAAARGHTPPLRTPYVKLVDPATGKPFPEDNWVWSPQGVVNMHYPEMWGFVQFSGRPAGSGTDAFAPRVVDGEKWMLRVLYYRERAFHAAHGFYTDDLAKLRLLLPPRPAGPWAALVGWPWPPVVDVTPRWYDASLPIAASADTVRASLLSPSRLVLTADGAVR